MSQHINKTGGVGGLLTTYDYASSTYYLPLYDGGGNVYGMLNATAVTLGGTAYSAGSLVATYEYDAFGKVLRESGPFAASNPFQYSTKYADIETGLLYYGHRHYNPSLGRFVGRDDTEEKGGLNLYVYCKNNSVNLFDILGRGSPYDGWAGMMGGRTNYSGMTEAGQVLLNAGYSSTAASNIVLNSGVNATFERENQQQITSGVVTIAVITTAVIAPPLAAEAPGAVTATLEFGGTIIANANASLTIFLSNQVTQATISIVSGTTGAILASHELDDGGEALAGIAENYAGSAGKTMATLGNAVGSAVGWVQETFGSDSSSTSANASAGSNYTVTTESNTNTSFSDAPNAFSDISTALPGTSGANSGSTMSAPPPPPTPAAAAAAAQAQADADSINAATTAEHLGMLPGTPPPPKPVTPN